MIIHIVNKDKFTVGYINFMTIYMNKWQHKFYLLENPELMDVDNKSSIQQLENWKQLNTKAIIDQLKYSEQIIISGAFFIHEFVNYWTPDIWKKVYVQLWGGDFYPFVSIKGLQIRLRTKKLLFNIAIKKANSVITLIDNDYDMFEKVYRKPKRHFNAIVPNNPKDTIDFLKVRKNYNNNKQTILIGNSASPENCHLEIFEILSYLAKYDVEIMCPLSYGDSVYRERVIEYAKQIFGQNFKPILNFMKREEYIELLNCCNVAIFNNNRQQALGNINIMLHLGKKVYLRTDTPMWNYYQTLGEKIYDINGLKNKSIIDLFEFDSKIGDSNFAIEEKKTTKYIEEWSNVFNS